MKSNKIKIGFVLMKRSTLTYGDEISYYEVHGYVAGRLPKGETNRIGLNIC
jgi:hypothetical protein